MLSTLIQVTLNVWPRRFMEIAVAIVTFKEEMPAHNACLLTIKMYRIKRVLFLWAGQRTLSET
jgi:hypothetical protein